MEKDISAKLFQILTWFKGTAHAQDSIKVLIELLGLKYLTHESDDGKALWHALADEPRVYEARQREIELLFDKKEWEARSLLFMLKSMRNTDLIGQLFHFIDRLDLSQDGYEIAWSLIHLHNRSKNRDFLSYPIESAQLVTRLLHIDPTVNNPVSVLCVGIGNLGIAIELRKQGAKVRLELPPPAYHAAILFSISGDGGECEIVSLNKPISSYSDNGDYHMGVIMPPWGDRIGRETQNMWSYSHYPIRPTNSESFYIQEAIERVRNRIIVMLPPGFLFRTAGTDLELKHYLVENALLEAVVQLPEKVLSYTMVAPVLLIINNRKRHEEVIFVDASTGPFVVQLTRMENALQNLDDIQSLVDSRENSDFSHRVSKAELADNEFNLSVKRYVLTNEERNLQDALSDEETVPLGEVVTVVRAQAIGSKDMGTNVYEVNPSDILDTGYIGSPSKIAYLSSEKIDRYDRQRLKPGDILLAIKGSVGRTGLVTTEAGEDWYAGQSFAILRLKPDSPIKDPVVLYRYLASDFAQQLLSSRSAGATVKLIKMQDLSSLPVVIPSADQQQEILDNNQKIIDLYSEIDSARQKIEVLKAEFWGLDSENG